MSSSPSSQHLTKATEITRLIGLLLTKGNAPLASQLGSCATIGTLQHTMLALSQNDLLKRWASHGRLSYKDALNCISNNGGKEPSVVSKEASPFHKAVAATFLYYPFGFSEVKFMGEWVFGPTFFARNQDPSEYDQQALVALMGEPGVYREMKDYQKKAMEIIDSSSEYTTVQVTVDKNKHAAKCSARKVLGTEADFELAYPHVRLLRSVRPDVLTSDNKSYHVCAWRDGVLQALVIGKFPCGKEELL